MYNCMVKDCKNKKDLIDITVVGLDCRGHEVEVNLLVCPDCYKKYFQEEDEQNAFNYPDLEDEEFEKLLGRIDEQYNNNREIEKPFQTITLNGFGKIKLKEILEEVYQKGKDNKFKDIGYLDIDEFYPEDEEFCKKCNGTGQIYITREDDDSDEDVTGIDFCDCKIGQEKEEKIMQSLFGKKR